MTDLLHRLQEATGPDREIDAVSSFIRQLERDRDTRTPEQTARDDMAEIMERHRPEIEAALRARGLG